jgi:hypothetical protein
VPRRGGGKWWGVPPQVAGQPGPLPLARERTGAGRCPPRRYPAPRRTAHPAVTRRACAAPDELAGPVVIRHVRQSPCQRSQTPGRNAAHCPRRPLHPQGHPKILSNRSAKTAPQKASSGPTLARGASADPAGLTARARPEARPIKRAANLSTSRMDRRGLGLFHYSLSDWSLCGIVAGVFCWPNASNAPLARPLAIMGPRGYARPSFIDPREPRQWHAVFCRRTERESGHHNH